MASAPVKEIPNFGQRYAVLNLDWMSCLVGAVQNTPEGQALIANYIRWNDAVHQKDSRPLTVFTTLSFSHGQPEVESNKPFANLIAPFGTFEAGTPDVQIDSRFTMDEKDILLPKTRWAATTGNTLEQILKAQGIETVVIVGAAEANFPFPLVHVNHVTVWVDSFRRRDEHHLSAFRLGL